MDEKNTEQKDAKQKDWQSYITIFVFCMIIFGLAVALIINPPTEFSETENRVLARMPELSMDTILSGDF